MRKSKLIGAALLAGTLTSVSIAKATLTTLVQFTGSSGSNAGEYPQALIGDAAGNLYGTTNAGGNAGYGTVFELAAGTHAFSTLVALQYNGTASPIYPTGNLAFDNTGNLYGDTAYNFIYDNDATGNGTVFKVAAGTHAFSVVSQNLVANSYPTGVITDNAGNLYGTTALGGNSYVTDGGGDGTLFKVSVSTGAVSTLINFNTVDGAAPNGNLTQDSAGNLYGTTFTGGPVSGDRGTVFKFTPGTGTLTTLAAFNVSNGSFPGSGLLADAAGNLYGMTEAGGANNDGTVFEVAAGTGVVTTLAAFNGANGALETDGFNPPSLIMDAAGNLFGTTPYGGTNNDGVAFEIATGTHTLSTLATFGGAYGIYPDISLIPDSAGNLYGITAEGGPGQTGTVFELSGIGFVVPEPSSLPLTLMAFSYLLCGRRVGRRRSTTKTLLAY